LKAEKGWDEILFYKKMGANWKKEKELDKTLLIDL